MKYKVTKSEFDNLSEEIKAHYEKNGDDYVLSLEGGPDVGEMKRAKDREKEKNRQLSRDLEKLQGKLSELQTEYDEFKNSNSDGSNSNPDNLQKAYERKLNELQDANGKTVSQLKKSIESLMLDAASSEIAGAVFNDPEIFKHHIENRFRVEFDDNYSPKLVILDVDGQDSLMNKEELTNEIVADKRFSNYIKGSNASGGGANGSHDGNGGAVSDSDLSKMTVDQRSAFVRSSPENAARFEKFLEKNN